MQCCQRSRSVPVFCVGFGSLTACDLADTVGRQPTIISGCLTYTISVIRQMFTNIGHTAISSVFKQALAFSYRHRIQQVCHLFLSHQIGIRPKRWMIPSSLVI